MPVASNCLESRTNREGSRKPRGGDPAQERGQFSFPNVTIIEMNFGLIFLGTAMNASTSRWPSSVATNSSLMDAFLSNSLVSNARALLSFSKKEEIGTPRAFAISYSIDELTLFEPRSYF
jgi:hypothetical protein